MTEQILLTDNPVFLLGLQRSGTTWLTNIFDSHPSTLVFMEPFAPAYGIFPEFPEASYFLNRSSPHLEEFLRSEVPRRLLHYKSLLGPRPMLDPALFRIERKLTRACLRWKAYLPSPILARARKHELLNLNRFDEHAPLCRKERSPSSWVIKELRLAGKIPVLRAAYPRARFVVMVRHPCANVHGILSWFNRGRLGELKSEMETFLDKLESQRVADEFQRQIQLSKKSNMASRLALYWRISNEVMFKELDGRAGTYFLTYEELASRPLDTVRSVLSFLGLDWPQSTADYLERSSTTEVASASQITTLRNSGRHYLEWQSKITEETRKAVLEITADSMLMTRFAPYYG